MTTLQAILIGIVIGCLIAVVAVFWSALVAPADRDEDAETDRAAIDSIRAELEAQEAPNRPHIRGLS